MGIRTLAIDVGASHVKAVLLDARGRLRGEEIRRPTPRRAEPEGLLEVLRSLRDDLPPFERASVGFPGVVDRGVVRSAVNLGAGWEGFRLQSALRRRLRVPVRVANDADVQGLGAIRARGVELVLTLGTGVGSSLFVDGRLVPNLELGHHPFRRGQTYEQQLGLRALKRVGEIRWNRRLEQAVETLRRAFSFHRLCLGGGNSRLVSFALPADVRVVSNRTGLLGGIELWREEESQ